MPKSQKAKTVLIFLQVIALVVLLVTPNVYADEKLVEKESSAKTYIVKFKNQTGKEKFTRNSSNAKNVKKNYKKQTTISVALSDVQAKQLESDNDVEYVELDFEAKTLSVGEFDKTTETAKKAKSNSQIISYGITNIGADQTFKKYDGKKVKVAILDTGVSNHEDIAIKGGISFVDYTTSYADDNGHGTHVAGIIAAKDNKVGVVGVAPNSEIYAVKVMDKYGNGSYSNIIEALEWAIDNNIDIVNMSLGGTYNSKALHEAILQANNAGIIIVAAAGNQGNGINTITYPAKYPEVISVGAVDENYKIASFSSRNSQENGIDIVAPGVEVVSLTNDGEYATMSGTSMATPHVTGAFAALKSKNKDVTSSELINKIYETATYLGNKNYYGYGVVNIAKATNVINGPVFPVNVDEENSAFNIVQTDKILNVYKETLKQYANVAYNNNDVELSKRISKKLEELTLQDLKLHELPEELKLNSKVKEENLALNEQINSFYSSKSEQFDALKQSFQDAINLFHEEIQTKYASDEDSVVNLMQISVQLGVTASGYSDRGGVMFNFIPPETGKYKVEAYIDSDAADMTSSFQISSNVLGSLYNVCNENYIEVELNFVANTLYDIRAVGSIWYSTYAGLLITKVAEQDYGQIYEGYKDVSMPAGQNVVYKFVPETTQTYRIFTNQYGGTSGSNDTFLELYSDKNLTTRIAYNDDYDGTAFSCISYSLNANTPYYIKLRHYNTTTALQARLNIVKQYLILNINSPQDIDIKADRFVVYKFTPTLTDFYAFTTSPYGGNGTASDTYLEIYSDQLLTKRLAYNNDYNGTNFSQIVTKLTAGTTYYIRYRGNNYGAAKARLTAVFFGDTSLFDTAKYHVKLIYGSQYSVSMEREPNYDDKGQIVSYKIPIIDGSNVKKGYITISVATDK